MHVFYIVLCSMELCSLSTDTNVHIRRSQYMIQCRHHQTEVEVYYSVRERITFFRVSSHIYRIPNSLTRLGDLVGCKLHYIFVVVIQ
jgi:hypothetical protein